MWPLNVRVIRIGSCTIDPGRVASPIHLQLKHQLGIGGSSTVTVICEGEETLLIDTRFDREADFSPANHARNGQALGALLRLHDLEPEQVTKVFVTHFPRDHVGGIEGFARATWCCLREALAECPPEMRDRFTLLDDGGELLPRTLLVHTPGHTPGHSSIVWTNQTRTLRVAVAGDAILSLAQLRSGYVWKWSAGLVGIEVARGSARRLLAAADLVVPGHGQPFFAAPHRGDRP